VTEEERKRHTSFLIKDIALQRQCRRRCCGSKSIGNTNEGKLIAAALLDNYNNIVAVS
jgi:hypothetical protein